MAAEPVAPAPGSAEQRAVALAERIGAGLRSSGRPDVAEKLEAERASLENPEVTVVVAGETNRGKSSLVNALLGRAGLSPVDADVSTNAHLVFRHADPSVVRVLRDDGTSQEVAPGAVGEWASVAGNPANAKGVRAVDVGLASPLLAQGLCLVDTPGVGGLEAAHAEVTLAALARADALLFVLDASTPLTAPELAFLARATERISTVVFALTKVDAYRGWRTILADDRALLAQRAPRFAGAPVVAVSARLALRALATPDEALAAALRQESGIDALEAELERRVAGRARTLRLGNLLQAGASALATLTLPLLATIAAADGNPAVKKALEAEQERWRRYSEDATDWATSLNDRAQDLKLEVFGELSRSVLGLKRKYDERVGAWKREYREELPQELATDLQALAARLETTLADRTATLVGELVESFGLAHLDVALEDQPDDGLASVLALNTGAAIGSSARSQALVAAVPSLISTATGAAVRWGGVGVASAGAAGAGLSALLWPAALVASGLVVAGLVGANRMKVQHQQDAKALVAATLSEASAVIRQDLEERTLNVQRELRDELKKAFRQRGAEIKAALEEHKRVAEADRGKQQEAKRAASRRLQALKALRQEADQAMAALQASLPGEPAVPPSTAAEAGGVG